MKYEFRAFHLHSSTHIKLIFHKSYKRIFPFYMVFFRKFFYIDFSAMNRSHANLKLYTIYYKYYGLIVFILVKWISVVEIWKFSKPLEKLTFLLFFLFKKFFSYCWPVQWIFSKFFFQLFFLFKGFRNHNFFHLSPLYPLFSFFI